MVSPSKTKYSRVAANQQQRTASSNKVKLVKGPKPLIYHRFYLDIQKHQLASKVENAIKELGGQIEFFLVKEITHFITDKDYHHQNQQGPTRAAADFDGGPSCYPLLSPATPTTPLTPKTPLSHYQHLSQHVNEASPSSPCIGTPSASAPGTAAGTGTSSAVHGVSGSEYKARPRSRADAMLQRVRQQQQQQHQQNHHSSNFATSRPGSPCSPAPQPSPIAASVVSNTFRLDRDSQSPVQLAKSWGKPIWSPEYAVRYFNKVYESCKADLEAPLTRESTAATRKATNLQHLRGDFVKIESFKRLHRPAFHLFKKWPVLNLNAKLTGSPFESFQEKSPTAAAASNKTVKDATVTPVPDSVKTTTTNATAKQQTQQQQQQCGYCEICRIDYDVLANHLVGQEHSAFVNNESNFVALDKLISDGGVSLKTFLGNNQEAIVVEQDDLGEVCEENDKSVPEEKCEVKKSSRETEDNGLIEDNSKAEESKGTEVQRVIRTYSRKSKDKNPTSATAAAPAEAPAEASSSSRAAAAASASVIRKYAGRKGSAGVSVKPIPAALSSTPPSSSSTIAAGAQMFGRRSAIHHHPHNTLNHHNHQKAKKAKLVQQAIINSAISASELATAAVLAKQQQQQRQLEVVSLSEEEEVAAEDKQSAPAIVAAKEMKVLSDSSSNEKEKERQSKRSAADRMGLKGSTIKPEHHSVELMECEGLDPKNTKRISLGLRQNPKRANLNEDFTSLLDETLEPMRKPRIRRESAKRINYSEPREDEIASQEEIMQSIIDSTAIKASEAASGGRKKGRAKSVDVKIRGIQWRAPSPQSRPPIKSPLLYKVIEDSKPSKSKKATSPTKESSAGGSPSKTNKNGIIVKIRRVRQSELSLLNDEAENFMFPKKDESSDAETDEDRQTSSELASGDYSQEIMSSDIDQRNSSMRRSAATPGPTNSRKRTPAPSKQPTDSPSKKSAKTVDRSSAPTPVAGRGGRRGSRGPAALLQDNAEYYKFPDPGSRLRFPEAPIQPDPTVEDNDPTTASATPANDNNNRSKKQQQRSGGGSRRSTRAVTPAPATVTSKEKRRRQQEKQIPLTTRSAPGSPCHQQEEEEEVELEQELALPSSCGQIFVDKGKEDGMGVFKWSNFNRNCKQIEPYRFAFERVPSLEPWYETFQRQDDSCEKMYEYFGNTAYRKLPYEMGPLPALQQNCCILNYRMKSKAPETNVPITTTTTTTCSSGSTISNSSNISSNSCGATTDPTTSITTGTESTSTTMGAPTSIASLATSTTDNGTDQSLSLPLKKRKLLIEAERPRKSPREHASTLAILSLLTQQQQNNRRRTISGSSSIPLISRVNLLRPPSPLCSPKKLQQQQQQEADSALGDEIRSSCGSDPVTEKEDTEEQKSGSRIKFDPPVVEDTFVDYKMMCQQLEEFLSEKGVSDPTEEDDVLFGMEAPPIAETVSIGTIGEEAPIKRDLVQIVQACDKEPPLSLKLVSRHESIVRKIVQYDRRPRALSSISVKSFDGGGSGFNMFRKRINRTGWPNAKKRIVTRKQQLLLKVKPEEGTDEVKREEEGETLESGDALRKSSTEESQHSGSVEETKVKQEEDDDEEEDDEFEDTMTMVDDEEPQTDKNDTLLTEDEEDLMTPQKPTDDPPPTPVPSRMEEANLLNRSRILPSSKYVTKTTTTMTRVDYNVPLPSSGAITNSNPSSVVGEKQHASSNHHHHHQHHIQQQLTPSRTKTELNCTTSSSAVTCPVAAAAGGTIPQDDDDKECDSISSRSIFVSDDCDTTSSTLINMCAEDSPSIAPVPLGVTPLSLRSATPLPTGAATPSDEPLDRPGSRVSRISSKNSRHPANAGGRRRRTSSGGSKSSTLQPIVCLEKLNCSSMRTRSSSRTPVKTYKRSMFTSALINSSGKPLKKKRKKKHKLNGTSSSASGETSSPICLLEEDQNPISSTANPTTPTATTTTSSVGSAEPGDDPSHISGSENVPRRSAKNRPPTPSPIKFSPRKLRKPRGRWYRER